jgi:hypothetical protein
MASELSMVAIGKYHLTRGVTADGLPNITAIGTSIDTKPGQGQVFNRTTAEVVQWESSLFGRYPFDSTGGIVADVGVGYALETQSRPVYDHRTSDVAGDLLAHELGHQWFGDSLTPVRWADIWLNEGFATYAEWLWQEEHGGPSVQSVFDELYANPAGSAFWDLKTADPGRENIFDYEAVYLRGGMTLHALRTAIGDEDFFTLLRVWAAKYRHGNAGTQDLVRLAESVSGKDLEPLFDAWLDTAAKPPANPA